MCKQTINVTWYTRDARQTPDQARLHWRSRSFYKKVIVIKQVMTCYEESRTSVDSEPLRHLVPVQKLPLFRLNLVFKFLSRNRQLSKHFSYFTNISQPQKTSELVPDTKCRLIQWVRLYRISCEKNAKTYSSFTWRSIKLLRRST